MMSGNIENGREYLLHVMECLKKRLAETDAAILEGEKEIEDMHEYYWENYTEMDEYGYENFDNQQALFRQMNANEEQFLLRKRFKKMMDSPFFGRVDFRYDGDDEPELFYIGIGGRGACHWCMTGVLRSADFFMITTRVLRPMRHLPVFLKARLLPNGSTRSAMEK